MLAIIDWYYIYLGGRGYRVRLGGIESVYCGMVRNYDEEEQLFG